MKTNASKENYYCYNPNFKARARKLRKRMTKCEKILWQMIRRRSICNCLFTRQRPVLKFIVDFMCKEVMLIIEVDGGYHETEEMQAKDKKRDELLSAAGFTILRFNNWELIASPNEVYSDIKNWIEQKISETSNNNLSKMK